MVPSTSFLLIIISPQEPWKLAVAGNDGVAIVWELADSKYENKHDRNYMK